MTKYSSYRTADGSPTWGIAHDRRLYDLGPTGLDLAPSLVDAISSGIFGNPDLTWNNAPSRAIDDVEFLPVVPAPGKIICVGVNYRTHLDEIGKPPPAGPTIFTRFADTQMGHLAPAVFPHEATEFDYEGEVALVIGKDGYKLSKENATDIIAGYGVYNDFSVRDWQRFSTQWAPGKNFPGTGAFGPYLVPASDIPDVTELQLETRVNGQVRQSAAVRDLIFDIPSLIEFVTTFTRLSVGDVIVTGTPGGVGLFMEPRGLLAEGDVVEVEVTGLGMLRNTVIRSETRAQHST
jgi:2-keto-4-pentenoate hydratase/2-oxohepta-3-ene-1,7-dioic acid hydratase in catechol pathway